MISDKARFEVAFAALEKRGIIARDDFRCCGSCAGYAIWNQERQNWRGGVEPIGGVYFHEQGTDNAHESRRALYLGHGAFDEENERADRRVAQIVVEVLREHGFEVEWTGSPARCIEVLAPAGRMWNLDYERLDVDECDAGDEDYDEDYERDYGRDLDDD